MSDDENDPDLEDHFFALRLAVCNKDQKMIETLYDANYSGLWELSHLVKLFELLGQITWSAGYKHIVWSYTTEILFESLRVDKQVLLLGKYLLNMDHPLGSPKGMIAPPFALSLLYLLLDPEQTLVTDMTKIRKLIERSSPIITLQNYLNFKYYDAHNSD